MTKRIAILQSNYIPWKGYFDLIGMVDEFVLYDDMQYTRRDWRNRNKIKTPAGLRWLTIPVAVGGRFLQRIDETEISDPGWAVSHWDAIAQSYRGAAEFARYRDRVEAIYRAPSERLLAHVNQRFLRAICALVGIQTPITRSTDYRGEGRKTERLVSLCRQIGATHYLSGPSARAYIDAQLFREAGITLEYMDYTDYPEYPQLHGQFEHGVSILDLLFNVGDRAPSYMKFALRAAHVR